MLSSLDYDFLTNGAVAILHHWTTTTETAAAEAAAAEATATATTTTTRHSTTRHSTRTHALTTTATTATATEEAILTAAEDVGTEDNVQHCIVGDSVVLGIAALHSTEHAADS